jgi:hypothetical protein
MKRTPITINFVADTRLRDNLREAAETDARSVSSLIRKIIQDWDDGRRSAAQRRREASVA